MHGGDAAGQIADLDLRQAGLRDHRGEFRLRRKAADAFGQIAIGFFIARHQPPILGSSLKE